MYSVSNSLKQITVLSCTVITFIFLSCGNPPEVERQTKEAPVKKELRSEDIKRSGTADGNRFFEDASGNKLFNGATFHNTHEFFRGYCVVSKMVDGKELNGIINLKGETVVDYKYDFIEDCYNSGYFKVTVKPTMDRGFIDSTGKIIIPVTYKDFGYINNGVLKAQVKYPKWGLITIKNETLTPFEYDYIGYWSDDIARVSKDKNHKSNYGFIDKTGKEIITCQYPVATDFKDGIALVQKGNKIGFINTKNETVIDFMFDDYQEIVDVSKDAMSVSGYKESNKRFIMEEGYIVVSKNKKWGYIDVKGNEIIPFEYSFIGLPTNGMVNLEKDGKRGIFDLKSKTIKWTS